MTTGHRPFHGQEHDPKLILDILDGKKPEITEDTTEFWANLMKKFSIGQFSIDKFDIMNSKRIKGSE
ncbi:hypothetical protein Glove_521g13 [Diversispora epigaea]|uniref:Uncharacterized protein n=1 Tax=Diversispora epigaea TaxID=1348612 RepID=A0A397GK57_9GLOM|nr:hypothetical protein Glove_521g13 [Diversispora epigaea]